MSSSNLEARIDIQCKERYLFACVTACLQASPTGPSEFAKSALREAYEQLDGGNALGSKVVARQIESLIASVLDPTCQDIETMKSFFLTSGFGAESATRCARVAVANDIRSARKLSLVALRDAAVFACFHLTEEEGTLVRLSLNDMYPLLASHNPLVLSTFPSSSSSTSFSASSSSSSSSSSYSTTLKQQLLEVGGGDDEENNNNSELTHRLRAEANSMNIQQLCAAIRQLLGLPETNSMADTVKASCKLLGVKPVGVLKLDATSCFLAAMEPAEVRAERLANALIKSQEIEKEQQTPLFQHQQQEQQLSVEVGPSALTTTSTNPVVQIIPVGVPPPPHASAPVPASVLESEPCTPGTPLAVPNVAVSSDKYTHKYSREVAHHQGTPPILPTTKLPVLGGAPGTGNPSPPGTGERPHSTSMSAAASPLSSSTSIKGDFDQEVTAAAVLGSPKSISVETTNEEKIQQNDEAAVVATEEEYQEQQEEEEEQIREAEEQDEEEVNGEATPDDSQHMQPIPLSPISHIPREASFESTVPHITHEVLVAHSARITSTATSPPMSAQRGERETTSAKNATETMPITPAHIAISSAPAPAAAAASSSSSAASGPLAFPMEQLPVLLKAFYKRNNPAREAQTSDILAAYKGREAELIRKLEKQYGTQFIVSPSN